MFPACPHANLSRGTVAWLSVARLLLPALLLVSSLRAQEFSYKKYGVKDGLPGSVVYHCVQDKKGFIWFATNRGVSRFDGKVFTNFTKDDGLPDNEILKLYIDKHDNIWFISFLGTPSVFYNGRIHTLNCKGVFYVVEDAVTDSIFLLANHSDDGLESLGYYQTLNIPGKWQFSTYFSGTENITFRFWPILRRATPGNVKFYFSWVDKIKACLVVRDRHTKKSYFFGDSAFTPFSNTSFIDATPNGKGVVFTSSESIFYCDIDTLRPLVNLRDIGVNTEKPFDVNFIFCETDSVLWLCTKKKGLIRIINYMQPDRKIQFYFPERFCSSILRDNEGGYWITSLDDAAYYVTNLDFFNLPGKSGPVTGNAISIRSLDPTRIAAGFADGTVLNIHLNNLQTTSFHKWVLQNKNNRVLDIWPYKNDRFLIATDGGLYMMMPDGSYVDISGEQGIKDIYVNADHTVLSGSATSVRLVNPLTKSAKPLYYGRVTCVAAVNDTYYWGTLKGVYSHRNGATTSLGEKYPWLDSVINHINVAPDSALWISTPDGIVVMKKNIVTTITRSHGLLSNRCKHVLFDSLTAWISTDQGISRVNYRWIGDSLSFTISNIMEVDGLLSSDVNETALGGDYIWAATEEGISYFSKDYESRPYSLPPVSIIKIVSGNRDLLVSDTIEIRYQKSDLLLELFCPSYRSCGSMYYKYRIPTLDTAWRTTNNSYIEFSSLPFGEFVLEITAVNKWGQQSAAPKKIVLINTPPFWKSTWFLITIYIVTLLAVAAAFYFFNRVRHRKKEQAYKIKQKMRDLEIMALRAQMNPHFIFNCMSSIQYYILHNDAITANLYLHKFSTLIRRTLQYSNVSVIPLSEEIKLLSLYLELEKMRLQERMEFQVIVKVNGEPNQLALPSMIIQPYVENAVKHGITPLHDKQGIVTVTFEQSAAYIHCTIEDNGIGINAGREKSREIEGDHTSMGNNITEYRIGLINSLRKNKILLNISDKQECNMTGTGTVVHLSFPVINE